MRRATSMRAPRWGALAGCVVLGATLSACSDVAQAWGDPNSIIVAASPELWAELEDTILTVLEPRIYTVRDEKMFKVTFQDPTHEYWGNLRRFRQMLLVGTRDAPWIAPALEGLEQVPAPPAIFQTYDVWARDQLVTVLLLPEGGDGAAVAALLPELRDLYETQYRDWATNRMFVSGRDTALADTLQERAGFTLLLPLVYTWTSMDDVYLFRNDNPDPAELIRQVTVTWKEGEQPLDAESLIAWRGELAQGYYSEPQIVDLTDFEATPFRYAGLPGFQVQAVWQNTPGADWPAAGPFILRAIHCPQQDRTYLLDAWLYAPGKEKFEYMIQLDAILGSFQCAG